MAPASSPELGPLASSPKAARPIAHTADRYWRDCGRGRSNGSQRAAHVVSLSALVVALFEVRFEAHCGLKSDIALGPESANERTRFRGRGWRRGRATTSAAVTL